MSLYCGLGISERIERIRRASQKLEAARAAVLEAETSGSREKLEQARALLRAHKISFGTDHLEIVDVIDRLTTTATEQVKAPAEELPASKPPGRAEKAVDWNGREGRRRDGIGGQKSR